MNTRLGRHARDCMLSAVAILLVCTPSAIAQEDCEYWAAIFSGRNAIERLRACIEAGADVNGANRVRREHFTARRG
ncbi:MAG: hypothetical protein F4087_13840 [Gemmatimonadetes bacterium]|nr:hypothetical protein [Gemmatimonadota bacterium]MYE68949.1 hypothetical protein [Gemmatimonadota bacterium]MYJ69569.1 hypothetical protein [Gemmatimonadota bacterium]